MSKTQVGYFLAVLMVALQMLGCKGDSLTASEYQPEPEAVGVSISAVISVRFSAALDRNTVSALSVGLFEQGTIAVPGIVGYQAERIFFSPYAKLKSATRYTMRISSSVRTLDGDELEDDLSWSFTTEEPAHTTGAITALGPLDFTTGQASVSLKSVGKDEYVSVIALNATQFPRAINYVLNTTGLDASGAFRDPLESDLGTQSSPAFSAPERQHKPVLRHPRSLKERTEKLRTLSTAQKNQANTQRDELPENFGRCKGTGPSGAYVEGQTCTFDVLDANDRVKVVTSTLRRIAAGALFFIDNKDFGDFSPAELATLDTSFSVKALKTNADYFGVPKDTDRNGKVIVLFTRELIDPVAKAGFLGYVAPWDMFPNGTTPEPSNEGDIFYAVTPSRVEVMGYSRAEYFNDIMPSTMVHELKHLIASGERLLNDRDTEELWIEEPSAVAAEQLAGFGTVDGRIQDLSDQALANPQDFNIYYPTRPSDNEQDLAMYGFNMLMLWRVAERVGHDTFWRSWMRGPSTGIENLEAHAAAGYPEAKPNAVFPAIMQDWALTLMLDHTGSLAGYDYQALNLRDGSWQTLGVQLLSGNVSDMARSLGFYRAAGNNADALIRINAQASAQPYFLIVRHSKK